MHVSARMTEAPFTEQRLDSWKSIARHFGRSCRTVQRWHADYGLPIHRLGGDTGSVFAFADELDGWMRNRGRALTDQTAEIGKPVLLSAAHLLAEPATRAGSVDFSLIPNAARARSGELVVLADKMWESLSNGNLTTIARTLREAIDVDPGNAAAFSGLAMALIACGILGTLRPPVAYSAAGGALQRALEIDSAAQHTLLPAALLKMLTARDWEGARHGFDETLKRQPTCARAMVCLAMLHTAEARLDEAGRLLLGVVNQRTLSSDATTLYCWTEYLAGRCANALFQIGQYRASGRCGPLADAVEALAILQSAGPGACIQRMQALGADSGHSDVLRGALGYAYAAAGQLESAGNILDALTRPEPSEKMHEPYAVALVLIGLNRKQEAVKRLEQSYSEGSLWSLGFRSDPILQTLRKDAHCQLFWSKVSYPVAESPGARLGFAG